MNNKLIKLVHKEYKRPIQLLQLVEKKYKNKKFLFGMKMPVGVNVFVAENDYFYKKIGRGVFFYSPSRIKIESSEYQYPTIIIFQNSGITILVHEIGHYLHWKKTKFKDLSNHEKQANIFGINWYYENGGNWKNINWSLLRKIE